MADPNGREIDELILRFGATPVSLARLELSVVLVPQVEAFRSAVGVRTQRRALFVRWVDADGAWGIGECSCRPDPFFSGEFVDGAVAVIAEHLFPLLPASGTVSDVVAAVGRIRGWPFTVAAVLDALFDLFRRRGDGDLLDLWPGEALSRVPVGISLGLFPDPDAAVARVATAVEEGYRRVKLKVAPSMDVRTAEAIRAAYPDLPLGFDANGTCGEDDFDLLERLASLRPVSMEQPFAPRRLDLHARLRERLSELTVCLDESVAGLGDLIAAHRLRALSELNIKPGRVGGPVETLRLLDYCAQNGIPAWVGGMFETGVGRLANLRVAARLPDALAHDLSPSRRYFARDVVIEPLEMDEGQIEIADASPPELDEDAFTTMAEFSRVLEASLEKR